MRKVAILVLAMVLVFGMSAGVMADNISGDATEDISVEVEIHEYARVLFPDGNEANLDVQQPNYPGSYGDYYWSDTVNFELQTNSPNVFIVLEENLSRKFADHIGDDNRVWATRGLDNYDPDWVIVTPDVFVDNHAGSREVWYEGGESQGIQFTSNIFGESGSHTGDIVIHTGWNEAPEAGWYELEPGTIEGEVIVTVTQ